MIVRPYIDDDFGEAKRLCTDFDALIRDLLPAEEFRFEAMAEGGIDVWVNESHGPGKAFFVAEDCPGHLVGLIQGGTELNEGAVLDKWGMLEGFYVDKTYRGQGVGAALYKALEEWFAGQGCTAAHVDTWNSNLPAIEAYKSLGFMPFYMGLVKEIKKK